MMVTLIAVKMAMMLFVCICTSKSLPATAASASSSPAAQTPEMTPEDLAFTVPFPANRFHSIYGNGGEL